MLEGINSSYGDISEKDEPKIARIFTEEFKPNPKIRITLIFSIFFFALQYA